MERLKKFLHVMILPCLVAMMFGLFTVQASAATIRIEVRDVTEASSTITQNDGTTCTVKLTPSAYFTYPAGLVVEYADGGAVPFSYDAKTGTISFNADVVYGNIRITGEAVAVKPIDQPVIEGSAVVGETLTVKVTPADSDVSYQWYQVKNGISTAIKGATSSTYEIKVADVGYIIDVTVINNRYVSDKKNAMNPKGPVEKRENPEVPSRSDV